MAKTAKKKTTGKPNAAFMKPMTPSPALAEVIGAKPIPRTEVTKKLWVYIKKNSLQDAKNRRMINADPALKTVFGGKSSVSMFEMTKLASWPLLRMFRSARAGTRLTASLRPTCAGIALAMHR